MKHSKDAEFYASKWVNRWKSPRKIKKRQKKAAIAFITSQEKNDPNILNQLGEFCIFSLSTVNSIPE